MQFKQMTSSHKALVMNYNNSVRQNTVALSHIFEYNKYQISMLELLIKKVCSVSFVSQYIQMLNVSYTIHSNLSDL